jgi:endonuclease YncB( thermonuclease family)
MGVPLLSRYILRPLLRNPLIKIILALFLFYLLLYPAYWQNEDTTVSIPQYQVIDGDSLRYRKTDGKHQEIRLWGIDAVELFQTCRSGRNTIPCGQHAKDALVSFLRHADIHCTHKDTDRYQRDVMQCFAHTSQAKYDIAAWMVEQGWALDYRQHSHGFYRSYEDKAKKSKSGIWAYHFDKPYEWRQKHRR